VVPKHENKASVVSWPMNGIKDISDIEFKLWSELLKERTGIVLSKQRKSFLLSKLTIRMQELGIEKYREYFSYVTFATTGSRLEWEILVDRLTVHETRFFRDARALSFITKAYFEKLNFSETIPNVHIWSVGCATGEEPYSLMMYIDKYLKDKNKKCYLAVTASDISQKALMVGKKAIYPCERFQNVSSEYIDAYLEKVDTTHYQIKEVLRKRICFNRFNLVNLDKNPAEKMNIIVCQNVLIYFNRETRITILNQLVERLMPGGLLVLGAGEISGWINKKVNPVQHDGVLAFQKKITVTEITTSQTNRGDELKECKA